RRLTVYSVLWHTLKTLTLMFNPATPFLSEFLYQHVYRKLDPKLPESVNFEKWPKPDSKLRDEKLEEEFDMLLKCVSLVYSARQSARLKRRWPLSKAIVVAQPNVHEALKKAEDFFLELANVKKVEYRENVGEEFSSDRWSIASEDNVTVYLDTYRSENLVGEGLMRDLARRVQSLRKELGFMPTDILNAVHIAELDPKQARLIKGFLDTMAELVRTRKVHLHEKREELNVEWHEYAVDGKKVYIAIT
ncbi:hypothetical protein DRO50_04680, partial [Candidatus Bathyarchaeota archaeon]